MVMRWRDDFLFFFQTWSGLVPSQYRSGYGTARPHHFTRKGGHIFSAGLSALLLQLAVGFLHSIRKTCNHVVPITAVTKLYIDHACC